MNIQVTNSITKKIETNSVNQEPDLCPYCNHKAHLKRHEAYYINNNDESGPLEFLVLYQCPGSDCGMLFLSRFEEDSDGYYYNGTIGGKILKKIFDNEIKGLSPRFIEIYNQSLAAQHHKLSDIAGVGFRKALEFLLKDYAVRTHPEEKDTIVNMPLSQVIENYVSNNKIKDISKRALWIGNDETHYIRKWGGKTTEDIKHLIDISLYWILMEINTDKALEDMKVPRK